MAKYELCYLIPQIRKKMTQYKNPYYELFFGKLKQYTREKKLRKKFSSDDFRFLIRDDASITKSYSSNRIRSFLSFCCMEDIKICQRLFVKHNSGRYERFSITDLSAYKTLQDYLQKNGLDHIHIKSEYEVSVAKEERNTLLEDLVGEDKNSGKIFAESLRKHLNKTN